MEVKISIVIPVYNVEKYLKECVDSVLAQTFSDYEIILVDDGSTDNGGKICDDYAKKDNRISVIHQKNGGLSSARNTGIINAKGKYIYFLDSDDYIEKYALEHLYKLAVNDNADVVFFDGSVFFTDCEPFEVMGYERKKQYGSGNGREILTELLNRDEYRTAVPLNLYNRDYLYRNNLKFKEGILHEDELFSFLVFNADGICSHCHEKLYARRFRPASIMTASAISRRFESMLAIYNEIAKMYKAKTACGQAATMYIIREAKSVIGKYNQLSDEQKIEYADVYKAFKKNVMSFKGFGDMKLKIKCSGKIGNIYYRALNKFFK